MCYSSQSELCLGKSFTSQVGLGGVIASWQAAGARTAAACATATAAAAAAVAAAAAAAATAEAWQHTMQSINGKTTD